ncbi:uncharacterized protein LOC105662084 isoform X2 [Megachile rotundata]|uniref:uncharacterized protein LOC105662084 isoform X2 n=1 Tax=Megachile rotundata TaxID=143995 RepID=UPI000614CE1E|nr:PREDICTED: uncharacterized protein LOC105662084 isoform X1 [Megachile rotundata]
MFSNSRINRDRPLIHIIKLIEEHTLLLNRLPNLLPNTTTYSSQLVQLFIETEFIFKLRNTSSATDIFQDTMLNNYLGHKIIYTDESKSDEFPAVGAACVIPENNFVDRTTIPKQTSVFTGYLRKNHQSMWIPSHKDIPGNKLADREAKRAAQSEVKEIFSVPCTDIFPLLKQKIVERAQNELTLNSLDQQSKIKSF